MNYNSTKVQISLRASKLHNASIYEKSDPYAVVTLLDPTQPKVLGRTETIKNCLDPQWTKVFLLDYTLGRPQYINIGIYDENGKISDKPMGSARFEIGEILGSHGNTKATKLKRSGKLFATVQRSAVQSSGKLSLCLSGMKLVNKEGFFGTSDPFFEISRKDASAHKEWRPVLRSKRISNTLNPNWEAVSIDLDILCDGDNDRPIKITVFDHEGDGDHKFMGGVETTVNRLIEAKHQHRQLPLQMKSGKFDSYKVKPGKFEGFLIVKEATISGFGGAGNANYGQTGVFSSSAPPSFPQMQPPYPSSYSQPQTAYPPSYSQPQTTYPPSYSQTQQPSFVDYLSGGCELKAHFAIDFTGSNGDPRIPGTLHHIQPHGLNDYEKAITAVGSIISKYDSDQRFPVWGFGARIGGFVRHCFQLAPEPEVDGIQGVMGAYRGIFGRGGLTLSGPTLFHEVIRTAAGMASSAQENAARMGKQCYTILVILTDGCVSDLNQAKLAIDAAKNAPLSIVIIGIGKARFEGMRFLDDFNAGAGRDITQFVEFRAHEHDKYSLTNATLEEIPRQLVQYFAGRGIMPNPPVNPNHISIVPADYNQNTDVDLSLQSNPDGEIVVVGGGGTFTDHTYDAGLQYLGGSAPPPTNPSYVQSNQPAASYGQPAAGTLYPSAPYDRQSYAQPNQPAASYGQPPTNNGYPSAPYQTSSYTQPPTLNGYPSTPYQTSSYTQPNQPAAQPPTVNAYPAAPYQTSSYTQPDASYMQQPPQPYQTSFNGQTNQSNGGMQQQPPQYPSAPPY